MTEEKNSNTDFSRIKQIQKVGSLYQITTNKITRKVTEGQLKKLLNTDKSISEILAAIRS